jgi:hypothetical protein
MVVAAVVGIAIGAVLGGGGDSTTVSYVTDTVTVRSTKTVRKVRVRTVTVDAAGVVVDDTATEEAPTVPETSTSAASTGDCSTDYDGACVPTDEPDLTCADLTDRNFEALSDPYGLDPDGDGVACET